MIGGVGIHGQTLEGKHLRLRKQVYRPVLSQVSEKLVVQPPSVLGPGRDNQEGSQPLLP